MKPVDIVMTTWKREWMTDKAIDALKKNTTVPFRLIVIDNGSDSLFQRYLKEEADVYVKLDKNYGLEYAKHLGMEFVDSPYFVSMDNDILVYKYEPDWLYQLLNLLDRNPDFVAIAPRPQILVGTGMYMFETEDELVPFGHVPGYARLMRTEWVRKTGAWSDKRELRGHEELWIGQKAAEDGVKMGWATKIRCWHLFGQEDTDSWGYPKGMQPEEHGHNPVWPMPQNDKDEIWQNVGVRI